MGAEVRRDHDLRSFGPAAQHAGPGRAIGEDLGGRREQGRLTEDDLRLVVLTRLGGVTFDALADEQGVPVGRLRQRRLRAECALGALM